MNWKMIAVDTLEHYLDLLTAVQNLQDQIRTAEMQMTSVRSATADGTAVHGGGCGREDMLLNCITERDKLQEIQAITCGRVKTIERALNKLTDTERDVLNVFYIEGQKYAADAIKDKYHVEKSEAHRMKVRALKRFARLMYGVTEI